MSRVAVVAPHPDDETLGCGGTLLSHASEGDVLFWIVFTTMRTEDGFSDEAVEQRQEEIDRVAARYGFKDVIQLGFPATRLDGEPIRELVERYGEAVREREIEVVYLPFRNDSHTDHRVVFDVAAACSKWFRYPSVRQVLAYETLSETGSSLRANLEGAFVPNVYVDISHYLEEKLEIMGEYASETGPHPFPRSNVAIRSLARLRGSESGFDAAEGFTLLRDRRKRP